VAAAGAVEKGAADGEPGSGGYTAFLQRWSYGAARPLSRFPVFQFFNQLNASIFIGTPSLSLQRCPPRTTRAAERQLQAPQKHACLRS
jgi:hypothetical protein